MVLSLKELKDEMENWSLYENSFVYNGVEYSLIHEPGTGKYYFCLCNTMDDHGKYFSDFDTVVNAPLLDGKSIAENISVLNWLG